MKIFSYLFSLSFPRKRESRATNAGLFSSCIPAFVGITLLLFSAAAYAHSYQQGDITIGHAWMRPVPKGVKVGAAYMPLLNWGADDALIAASTPVAEKVEFHNTVKNGDVYEMRQESKVELPKGQPVAMNPKGRHIMLFGVKNEIKPGDKVPLTLEFAKAGKIVVELWAEENAPAHETGH